MFALSNEPIDYQISVHINNLFNTYGRFHVLTSYDFIKSDPKSYKVIYEDLKPSNDYDKMNVAIFNLLSYYGMISFDLALTELFGEAA